VPRSSPSGRCALTAPFHPYREPRPVAVCFLWHFPSSHLDWPLASTLPFGARTFLDEISRSRHDPPHHLQREAGAVYAESHAPRPGSEAKPHQMPHPIRSLRTRQVLLRWRSSIRASAASGSRQQADGTAAPGEPHPPHSRRVRLRGEPARGAPAPSRAPEARYAFESDAAASAGASFIRSSQ